MMDIWKIKLTRQEARKGNVPFSLFYLVQRPDIEEFRGTFETFLAFPARLAQIRWDVLRTKEVNGTKTDTFVTQVVRGVTDVGPDWQVVVPILSMNQRPSPKMHPGEVRGFKASAAAALDLPGIIDAYKLAKEEDGPRPAYLTDKVWKNWKAHAGLPQANPAYPETTYFVTREDIFVPPCIACPRYGRHEAGECHVGDSVCYVSLRYYKASARMFVKLREYDDIQESIDGLLENERHAVGASEPTPTTDVEPD